MSQKTNIRSICFFWPNQDLINAVSSFLGQVGYQSVRFDSYIVTSDFSGKLFFLNKGINAFTISELIENAPKGDFCKASNSQIENLLVYDLGIGHFKIGDFGGREGLDEYARGVLNAFSFLIREIEPHVCFVWNGATFWQRALAHVAREHELPCFFMERGFFPGTLVVDPEGVNYGSSIAGHRWQSHQVSGPSEEEKIELDAFRQNLRKKKSTIVPHGRDFAPEEAKERLGVPSGATIVLLPLQIESDSNIRFYSPHYKTMHDVIREVAEAMEVCQGAVLVVKPHPEDEDRLAELEIFEGGSCRLSRDISLPTLLNCADVVVTINSTVGIEALICGKPVVVLGQAIYSEKGFTYDVLRRSDLKKQLERAVMASSGERDNDLFDKFLIYLLRFHLFCLEGGDPWGSRKAITKMIFAVAGEASKKVDMSNVSAGISRLIDRNESLMNILGPSPESVKRKMLVLFDTHHLGKDMFLTMRRAGKMEECPDLTLGKMIATLLKGKYALILSDRKRYGGIKGFMFRIWWASIRSDEKIILH